MVSDEMTSPVTLGAALLGLMLSYAAQAAPVASVSGQFAKSDVLLVQEARPRPAGVRLHAYLEHNSRKALDGNRHRTLQPCSHWAARVPAWLPPRSIWS